MAQQTTYTCDACGAQKHNANHWFRMWINGTCLTITAWDDGEDDGAPHLHLCGAACVIKKVSEFVGASTEGTPPFVPIADSKFQRVGTK